MKRLGLLTALFFTGALAYGQEDPKVQITGYLETYFGYDFNRPADHNRPGFIYSHHREQEVNLNLGYLKSSYTSAGIRANLALMTGTYAQANLAAEPAVLRNIFEANAGLKLSEKAGLWLDAGIFSSHIGFESAISKDCWMLTRGIASENSPYYETGVKITYGTADGKFSATALYLNGWQRITRQNGIGQPAGGLQLSWKPNPKFSLNYSNYLGTEGTDSAHAGRSYHQIYGVMQLTGRFGLILALDYAAQQKEKGDQAKNRVFSPAAVAQYQWTHQWTLAGRVEYYQDKGGVFIATGTPHGFMTTGYALNVSYSPVPKAIVRLEGKIYYSKDPVFVRQLQQVSANAALTASLAVSF